MTAQLISTNDYKRIFETIYSVLKFIGKDPSTNCTYFSIIGALLLHEHFGITCKSYSGAASYYLDDEEGLVLSFVEQVGPNSYTGTSNGFHSWNQNEDFIVDFQAPLFPEIIKTKFHNSACPVKMFQRKLNEQCQSPLRFKKTGDFFHSPDFGLTKHIVDVFTEEPLNMDLFNICNKWFTNPISTMKESIEIKTNTGQIMAVNLQKIELFGQW